MSLFSFLKIPKQLAVKTPADMEAVACEKILNESRAKNYVTIERCQSVEYYENTFLTPMPKNWQMDIFEYPSLLRACLSDIEMAFLDCDDKVCDYCNARYNFVDTNPLILLTTFPYTIFKVPPADASDLKVVFRKGWIGHVQAPGYSFNCTQCGHGLHFKTEQWWQGSRDWKQHGTIPLEFPGRRIS